MEPIIKVDNVSMCFNLSTEKHESLKEYLLAMVQGRLQYDEFYALRDVSLDIMPGDFYGLVGLNGSGKSTLLKTIAGVYKPSKGKVTVNGTIAPLIELGAGFDMDLTARENIYLNGTVLGFSPKYLIKSMVSSFSKITECPIVELQEDIASYLIDYFSLLARVTCDEKLSLPSEMTEVSLRSILTAVGLIYQRYSSKNHNTNRKEEICRELVGLVTEHYTEERRAQFYADKLGISLQHLSTTVKQVTGRNVLDVIAYVVIIDAKAKLKSSNMTIQEIAYSLNFPSASFFGKYFRRYVGMSPLEFRNS